MLPLEVSPNQVGLGLFAEHVPESYHIGNMVRVHLIQVLIIDVRIGKVKPVDRLNKPLILITCYQSSPPTCSTCWPHTHPSTRSPMLSRWPRNVRQWYCWLVSISDVFWTHTSARVCCFTLRENTGVCLSHSNSITTVEIAVMQWTLSLQFSVMLRVKFVLQQ